MKDSNAQIKQIGKTLICNTHFNEAKQSQSLKLAKRWVLEDFLKRKNAVRVE